MHTFPGSKRPRWFSQPLGFFYSEYPFRIAIICTPINPQPIGHRGKSPVVHSDELQYIFAVDYRTLTLFAEKRRGGPGTPGEHTTRGAFFYRDSSSPCLRKLQSQFDAGHYSTNGPKYSTFVLALVLTMTYVLTWNCHGSRSPRIGIQSRVVAARDIGSFAGILIGRVFSSE